jgi:hypothetical protein
VTVSDIHGGRVVWALVYGSGGPISILALFIDFSPLHSENFLSFFSAGAGFGYVTPLNYYPAHICKGVKQSIVSLLLAKNISTS